MLYTIQMRDVHVELDRIKLNTIQHSSIISYINIKFM